MVLCRHRKPDLSIHPSDQGVLKPSRPLNQQYLKHKTWEFIPLPAHRVGERSRGHRRRIDNRAALEQLALDREYGIDGGQQWLAQAVCFPQVAKAHGDALVGQAVLRHARSADALACRAALLPAMSHITRAGPKLSLSFQLPDLISDRKLSNPLACRGKNGIGQCGHHA